MKHYSITRYVEGKHYYAIIDVAIKDNLKPHKKKDRLRNFGHIELKPIKTSVEQECLFWDNLTFFLESSIEEIHKDCLHSMLVKDKKVLRKIKKAILEFKEKGYLL